MALCQEVQQERHSGPVLRPLGIALVSLGVWTALSTTVSVFMCHTCLVIHSKYSNNKYTNSTSHNYAFLFFSVAIGREGTRFRLSFDGYFKCTQI